MEGLITLKYTVDGGTTWSSASSIQAECRGFLRYTESSDESKEYPADNEEHSIGTARLIVKIKCGMEQFSPTMNPSTADALYVFVNKLRCASKIHLLAPAAIDGFGDFTPSTNTAYLTPDNIPDIEFNDVARKDLREIDFSLKMIKGYSIAP